MKLADFLVEMVQKQASDLFISVDAPQMVNVEGAMTALNDQPIDQASAHALVRSILDENQLRDYEKDLELNIALQVPDAGRFRVNCFTSAAPRPRFAGISGTRSSPLANWVCRRN